MKTVTSFESNTPEQELAKAAEEKFDYSQVVEALRNNRTVAENVYARCAKHHFKARLGEEVTLVEEAPPPLWMTTSSLTLVFDGEIDCRDLEGITEALLASVSQIRNGRKIRLVGALNTKITEVGLKVFTFSLKQKWGLDVE